jgi:hypothetical protein
VFTATAPTTPTSAITGPATIGPTAFEVDSDSASRVLPRCRSVVAGNRLGRYEV